MHPTQRLSPQSLTRRSPCTWAAHIPMATLTWLMTMTDDSATCCEMGSLIESGCPSDSRQEMMARMILVTSEALMRSRVSCAQHIAKFVPCRVAELRLAPAVTCLMLSSDAEIIRDRPAGIPDANRNTLTCHCTPQPPDLGRKKHLNMLFPICVWTCYLMTCRCAECMARCNTVEPPDLSSIVLQYDRRSFLAVSRSLAERAGPV